MRQHAAALQQTEEPLGTVPHSCRPAQPLATMPAACAPVVPPMPVPQQQSIMAPLSSSRGRTAGGYLSGPAPGQPLPPAPPPSAQRAACQPAAGGQTQNRLSTQQGSALDSQASQCGGLGPGYAQSAGGSKGGRHGHASPQWRCAAAAARCLPVLVLPLLLCMRLAADLLFSKLDAPVATACAWRLACAWGGIATLFCAQVAHARRSWRVGAVLDALCIRLLYGASIYPLVAGCCSQSSAACHVCACVLPRPASAAGLDALPSSPAGCCNTPFRTLPAAALLLTCRLLAAGASLACSTPAEVAHKPSTPLHVNRLQLGRGAVH